MRAGMSLWGTIMGGVNLVEHAAGWLEGGLTASFEKLILDAEMLQMMREFLNPIDRVDRGQMAMDAIARGRTRRAFLRHRPYAGALRDRVLCADALATGAISRTGRRRVQVDGTRARQCDLERAAADLRGAADGSRHRARRSTPMSPGARRRSAASRPKNLGLIGTYQDMYAGVSRPPSTPDDEIR